MLGGEYRHSLDPKNRIFIPAKLREELGGSLVITKSIRKPACLKVYSEQGWREYVTPLLQKNRNLVETVVRYLQSSLAQLTPDAQGRIVLPQELIGFAGIERNVVIVGCYDYAEIWAEDSYERLKSEMDYDKMLQELEALGL